ncbi:MAG TPA: hypothetical protein VD994_00980, partial [Prosthecobacter sp.]|nr:hypothetical protein [Prosthecobacter sp.]
TLNAVTGALTGRPTTAKMVNGEPAPYTVTFSASNAAGSSNTVTVQWLVLPLPSALVGTFNGLTAPSEELSLNSTQRASGLGGTVSVSTTATGSYSGRIVVDTVSYGFSGKLIIHEGEASGSCVIKRKECSSLSVAFAIDPETGHLTGSVSEGSDMDAVPFSAWRNCWHATNCPATAYAGVYTSALEMPEALLGNSAFPQGNGFGTLKITAAGVASWSGKLADGTTATASTTTGPNGQIGLHIPLYTPTIAATAGSVNGWIQVDAANQNAVNGTLRWKKNAQASSSTTRSYKSGFPAHDIAVLGGQYLGTPIVIPPSEGRSTGNNAVLTFSGGGLEHAAYSQATDGEIRQTFKLIDGRTVSMPTTLALNPASVRLTVNATSGLITGTFTLRDADPTDTSPPIAVITRTVSYTGVMVPRLNQGVGHFILPQLPSVSAGTTLTTSPQLSGQVLLDALR